MNKKLRRLMQPNLALFFVVMALFCAAAVALQEYILAVAEGCATLLLLGCYQWLSVRRRRALADYVQATSEMLQHTSDGEMPFPVALVKLNDNELVWYNRAFAELTHVRERMSAQSLSEVIPGLSADFLAAGKQEAAAELRFEGRRYRVSGTVMPDADPKSGVMLGMLYLLDLTDLLLVRDEYIRSRPIVSIVLVDNYDELTNNMPDVSISTLNAQLNSRISEWADSFGGMLRKLERNRFLLLFEAKDLARMADGKFSLLESVRSVTSPTGIPATVSIGIGKDGVDFREDYDFAALSIEMALSRGGDQAVIKDRYNFTFYGGRTKETERHTRVKSRVVAGSLSELIAQSSQVFIMGHRMADLDALGAAAGIVILTAAARGFSEAAGGAANDAVDMAGALGISAVLLRDFSGVLSLCRSALDGISVFSATLQPVLAAALSMGGSAVTATTLQVASMFAFDLVLRLIEGLLVPAVCVYLAVTVVDAAAGNGVLRGLAEGIGSLSAGALKLILTLFTAYLAVAGGVSGNVDRVALKTAKFAVSGAVPVVGGVMSDAAETVLSGAVLLRGSVGVFGMICVTAICLAPFVRAGACYLCFKAGAALLSPLCSDSLRRLLSGIGTGFGLLLGMLSAACTILYLELVYAVAMVKPL